MSSTEEAEAALREARREGREHGERIGRLAMIERVRTIMGCPEAQGRTAQALMLALDTTLEPGIVAKALAASPTTVAPTRPPLDQRQNPAVPGGAPDRPSRH